MVAENVVRPRAMHQLREHRDRFQHEQKESDDPDGRTPLLVGDAEAIDQPADLASRSQVLDPFRCERIPERLLLEAETVDSRLERQSQ